MKSRFTLSIIQALCWTLLLAGCNPEDPKIENNIIFYTTTNGQPIVFNVISSLKKAEPTSHTYEYNIGTLVFDTPITSIGLYAFCYCTNLKAITIPESVTWIGDFAFFDCSGLTNITIPESVTEIGERAFYGCSSLTSITIPNGVTTIGKSAFHHCTHLTSVYCKPTIPPLGNANMFADNASGRKIYVPSGSVEAYKTALYWSSYAGDIVGYDF